MISYYLYKGHTNIQNDPVPKGEQTNIGAQLNGSKSCILRTGPFKVQTEGISFICVSTRCDFTDVLRCILLRGSRDDCFNVYKR